MMLGRLFTQAIPDALFGSNGGKARTVIVGGINTGKTSLAFRLAYESAAEGHNPLFICNQAKLEGKLPLVVSCVGEGNSSSSKMTPEVLSRISMKYVSSMNELKSVIAGLHAFSPTPSMVIIDDMSLLIDPLHSVQRSDPKFLEICWTLGAFMDDVLRFISEKSNTVSVGSTVTSKTIELIITDSCEEAAYLSVLRKTAPNMFELTRDGSGDSSAVMVALRQGTYGRQNLSPTIMKVELHQGSLVVSSL